MTQNKLRSGQHLSIKGISLSTDYALLWDLIHAGHRIPSYVVYSTEYEDPIWDVVEVKMLHGKYTIGSRGAGYDSHEGHTLENFIHNCERFSLHFVHNTSPEQVISPPEEIDELVIQAKDSIAHKRDYHLFRRETGGWTRFDKMWDEAGDKDRKIILDEIAHECVRLCLQKLPTTPEDISDVAMKQFEHELLKQIHADYPSLNTTTAFVMGYMSGAIKKEMRRRIQAIMVKSSLFTKIPDWAKIQDGYINVPDELDPLINKLGFQMRLYTISQTQGEAETIAKMAYASHKFFQQLFSQSLNSLIEPTIPNPDANGRTETTDEPAL